MAIVICDTSSLIKLSITETLRLLPEIFRTVIIPKAVYQECPLTLRTQIDNLGFSLEIPKTCVFVQFGECLHAWTGYRSLTCLYGIGVPPASRPT